MDYSTISTKGTGTAKGTPPAFGMVIGNGSPPVVLKTTPFALADSSIILIKPPSNAKSVWWQLYHRKKDDICFAVCNICGLPIKCNTGTTGLMRHIESVHEPEYHLIRAQEKAKEETSGSANKKQRTLDFNPPDSDAVKKKKFDDLFGSYIVKSMRPLAEAANEDLRAIFALIGKTYYKSGKPPKMSMSGLDKWITDKSEECRREIKTMSCGQVVSVTTDHWSSRNQQNYVGMTAHWIDENFILHAYDMGCWLHEGKSDHESLVEDFLDKTLNETGFDPSTRLFAITSDSAASMIAFGEKLTAKYGVQHVYCTDHNIQLTAKLALDDKNYNDVDVEEHYATVSSDLNSSDDDSTLSIGVADDDVSVVENFEVLSKLRHLLTKFTKSNQNTATLKAHQRARGVEFPKKVRKDVVTRWWSTFGMIERARELEPDFKVMAVFREITVDNGLEMTQGDWDSLAEIETVLKPFMQAQKRLEGDKYPTAGMVLPTVQSLMIDVRALKTAVPEDKIQAVARNVSVALYSDLKVRWGNPFKRVYREKPKIGRKKRQIGIHPLFCVASILDPRVKKLYFLPKSEKEKIINALREQMKVAVEQNLLGVRKHLPKSLHCCEDEQAKDNEDTKEENEDEAAKKKASDSFWAMISANDNSNQSEDVGACLDAHIDEELKLYCKCPQIKGNNDDPLQWWREHCDKYPIVAALARVYLAVPATSASSERIFSKGEQIISKNRTSLSPAKASKLIWLAGFMKQKQRINSGYTDSEDNDFVYDDEEN